MPKIGNHLYFWNCDRLQCFLLFSENEVLESKKWKFYPIQIFCMGSVHDSRFCLLFYYAQLKRDPLSAGHLVTTEFVYLFVYLPALCVNWRDVFFTSPILLAMFILHYDSRWFLFVEEVPKKKGEHFVACKLFLVQCDSIYISFIHWDSISLSFSSFSPRFHGHRRWGFCIWFLWASLLLLKTSPYIYQMNFQ